MTGPIVGPEALAAALAALAADAQALARAARTCACGHHLGLHELDPRGRRTRCLTYTPDPCGCPAYRSALAPPHDDQPDRPATLAHPERTPRQRRTSR